MIDTIREMLFVAFILITSPIALFFGAVGCAALFVYFLCTMIPKEDS